MEGSVIIPDYINLLQKSLEYFLERISENNAVGVVRAQELSDKLEIPLSETEPILFRLVNDNVIDRLTEYREFYINSFILNDEGRNFLRNGGYTEYYISEYKKSEELRIEKENILRRNSLEMRQMESNIQVAQSVIDTNESIRGLNDKTEKNYTVQKNLTIAIFAAALISAIAACIPFFKNQKTPEQSLLDTLQIVQKKVTELEKSLKSQSKTVIEPLKESKKDSLANSKKPM